MENNYKSLAVKLSLWAQGKGIPGASPAWLTALAKKVADSKNPALVEKFIKTYGIDFTQATRCSKANTASTCASKYGTLNEFFTRKIPYSVNVSTLVSPATCKCTVFDTFQDSKIWVKGAKWSAARLLGMPAATYDKFAVGIFRLRPADYHRFHCPVRGSIAFIRQIQGGYLSVDPEIVRKRNVFTENNRVVLGIVSPIYGLCYYVAVGAAGVGRVKMTKNIDDPVNTGDELGYFEFGGSTVVVLIPSAGRRVWRADLVKNSLAEQETYVTVGTNVAASQ